MSERIPGKFPYRIFRAAYADLKTRMTKNSSLISHRLDNDNNQNSNNGDWDLSSNNIRLNKMFGSHRCFLSNKI
ncbi:hypothetical protein FFIC_091400 [Fructobacillus ficulneus]|uniref:Uncharacterized protein n=1 Tax=Fructobacillus ficulneus TaxID=157463 RepID=A0A0K8MGI4_9LACO|nr:hypothetical protein FFIC_091400 [Fructobacillus ficulneus]